MPTAAVDSSRNREVLSNVLRNLRRLLTGKVVSALLQLLAMLLMARTLAPEQFGLVVLLHSYMLVWGGVFNCKPFEAIIRYGVPALENNDHQKLLRLLKLGILVDVCTSLGATVLAVACAGLIGQFLSWNHEFVGFAQLYSLVLLTGMTGTAKGILRLYNRFDLLSTQLAIAPIIMCIGSGIAWQKELGMPAFIVTWWLAILLERLYLILKGLRELKNQIPETSVFEVKTGDWRSEFAGVAGFTNVIYWQSNLDLIPRHGASLLVGLLLGPAAAGLYKLARSVAAILSAPAVLLRQVLFPDLTRIWNRGDSGFYWILAKTATGAALLGLIFVVVAVIFGEQLLEKLAGAEYTSAAIVMSWLLIAATLDLCSSILRSAAYAMGNAGKVLQLNLTAMLVYLLSFIVATTWIGLAGPGIAATSASTMTFAGMLLLVSRKRQ